MGSAINITRFQRLREPPRCPGLARDQTWWEADVTSNSTFFTIWLWVAREEERSISGDLDEWALGELKKLCQSYSPLGKLYAFHPHELKPAAAGQPQPA